MPPSPDDITVPCANLSSPTCRPHVAPVVEMLTDDDPNDGSVSSSFSSNEGRDDASWNEGRETPDNFAHSIVIELNAIWIERPLFTPSDDIMSTCTEESSSVCSHWSKDPDTGQSFQCDDPPVVDDSDSDDVP